MVDWLYGELDEPQAQMFSTHVDSCARCTAEQTAFARTRTMFRDIPMQEPSPGLTAMLVREAALSAKPAVVVDAERESSGGFSAWLSQLLQPLMHPAFGALAMLVLVAGVGGVLYMKKGDDHVARPDTSEASQPTTDSSASAPMKRPSAASAAPASAAKERAKDVAEEALADPQNKQEADEFATTDDRDRSRRFRGGAELDGRPADILDSKRDDSLKLQAMKKGRAPSVTPKQKKPVSNSAVKRNANKKVGLSIASDQPATNTTSTKSGSVEGLAGGTGESEFADGDGTAPGRGMAFGGKDGSDWAMNKDDELIAAYNRKDCLETARLANDIREKQPKHYSNRTASLTAVKRCRQYVNSERKRRARVAAKKKRSKSKAAPPAADANTEKSKPAKK